jgi:hypothetical protein
MVRSVVRFESGEDDMQITVTEAKAKLTELVKRAEGRVRRTRKIARRSRYAMPPGRHAGLRRPP